jgi:hypothetical protein
VKRHIHDALYFGLLLSIPLWSVAIILVIIVLRHAR